MFYLYLDESGDLGFDFVNKNPSRVFTITISHAISHEHLGLQAVDLFAWGIFRKHEKKDVEWFEIFSGKIVYDEIYLP